MEIVRDDTKDMRQYAFVTRDNDKQAGYGLDDNELEVLDDTLKTDDQLKKKDPGNIRFVKTSRLDGLTFVYDANPAMPGGVNLKDALSKANLRRNKPDTSFFER